MTFQELIDELTRLKDAGFGETELVLSVTDHTDWTYNLDFPGFDIENQRLDLTKDISTEFTYAIDDIKDFASRNTSFSKTIVIPGNDANNTLNPRIYTLYW